MFSLILALFLSASLSIAEGDTLCYPKLGTFSVIPCYDPNIFPINAYTDITISIMPEDIVSSWLGWPKYYVGRYKTNETWVPFSEHTTDENRTEPTITIFGSNMSDIQIQLCASDELSNPVDFEWEYIAVHRFLMDDELSPENIDVTYKFVPNCSVFKTSDINVIRTADNLTYIEVRRDTNDTTFKNVTVDDYYFAIRYGPLKRFSDDRDHQFSRGSSIDPVLAKRKHMVINDPLYIPVDPEWMPLYNEWGYGIQICLFVGITDLIMPTNEIWNHEPMYIFFIKNLTPQSPIIVNHDTADFTLAILNFTGLTVSLDSPYEQNIPYTSTSQNNYTQKLTADINIWPACDLVQGEPIVSLISHPEYGIMNISIEWTKKNSSYSRFRGPITEYVVRQGPQYPINVDNRTIWEIKPGSLGLEPGLNDNKLFIYIHEDYSLSTNYVIQICAHGENVEFDAMRYWEEWDEKAVPYLINLSALLQSSTSVSEPLSPAQDTTTNTTARSEPELDNASQIVTEKPSLWPICDLVEGNPIVTGLHHMENENISVSIAWTEKKGIHEMGRFVSYVIRHGPGRLRIVQQFVFMELDVENAKTQLAAVETGGKLIIDNIDEKYLNNTEYAIQICAVVFYDPELTTFLPSESHWKAKPYFIDLKSFPLQKSSINPLDPKPQSESDIIDSTAKQYHPNCDLMQWIDISVENIGSARHVKLKWHDIITLEQKVGRINHFIVRYGSESGPLLPITRIIIWENIPVETASATGVEITVPIEYEGYYGFQICVVTREYAEDLYVQWNWDIDARLISMNAETGEWFGVKNVSIVKNHTLVDGATVDADQSLTGSQLSEMIKQNQSTDGYLDGPIYETHDDSPMSGKVVAFIVVIVLISCICIGLITKDLIKYYRKKKNENCDDKIAFVNAAARDPIVFIEMQQK